jgi:hypothetical protein
VARSEYGKPELIASLKVLRRRRRARAIETDAD